MSKSKNPVENGSSKNSTSASDKTKLWLYGEVVLVCLLIIGVWCLASLPILFYNLPKSEAPSNTSGSTNASGDNSTCSVPVQYTTTNGICLTELANILISSNCLLDPEGSLVVMRNEENKATQLINGISSLGASAECLSKAVPFLCLHLFGLCGGSEVSIQPTFSQCEEIRDTTCQQQWSLIERLDIGLPDCEIFPAESLSCPALNNSLSTSTKGIATTNILDPSSATVAALECTGDFYQENGSSYCTRSCNTWVKYANERELTTDVTSSIFVSISFLTSAAIVLISCLSRKRMLIFPAIFIVYIFVDYLILDIFILAGFMNRDKLYCTSRSLTKSLREVTSFCIIFGIVFTYITCQVALWWLLHTATLFWKVVFPLHALSFELSGKNKYIHVTCTIVGILLPLVPIVTIVADTAVERLEQNENSTFPLYITEGLGFGPYGFPPILCSATNPEANFYSFIIMVDIILGCGCTLFIIILWSVHKFYIKRKQMQKNINFFKGNEKPKPHFTFGTAEKKLLVVFLYYVILIAIVLSVFTWDTRTRTSTNYTIQKFLICELGSNNSSNSCTSTDSDSIAYYSLQFFSFVLWNLLPVGNLLYVVNIQELKELCRKCMVREPKTIIDNIV